MSGLVLLLCLLSLLIAPGCNQDPYKELVASEDLGTGVTLGSPFSTVPRTIAATIGESFANRNVSTSTRYYKFMDAYSDYGLIVADWDQDRKVDAILLVVYARSGEPEQKVDRFRAVFPNVRTRNGITIGDTRPDVVEKYQTVKHGVRDARWIHSSAGHLHFRTIGDTIAGIWLLDDPARPVTDLIGDDYV